jgi:hypothetical protein
MKKDEEKKKSKYQNTKQTVSKLAHYFKRPILSISR